MAASATSVNLTPLETAIGLKLNNLDCEIQIVQKLSGDTLVTITPVYLSFVLNAYFLSGSAVGGVPLVVDTGAAIAITNTQGSQSVALTTLTTGSGTLNGIVVLVGTTTPIHPA